MEKQNAAKFLDWCNEPVYRAPGNLSFESRAKAQFPDYNSYTLINDKGKSVLPEGKFLSAEELYDYWCNKYKVQEPDWKEKLIDSWKPIFELYPTLTALPVYAWGRYYKYECSGSAFENFVDERGFRQFLKLNVKFKGFDKELLETIEEEQNSPGGKIWTGELCDYSIDRIDAVKSFRFDEAAGRCLIIEKIENKLVLNAYRCDSPE